MKVQLTKKKNRKVYRIVSVILLIAFFISLKLYEEFYDDNENYFSILLTTFILFSLVAFFLSDHIRLKSFVIFNKESLRIEMEDNSNFSYSILEVSKIEIKLTGVAGQAYSGALLGNTGKSNQLTILTKSNKHSFSFYLSSTKQYEQLYNILEAIKKTYPEVKVIIK